MWLSQRSTVPKTTIIDCFHHQAQPISVERAGDQPTPLTWSKSSLIPRLSSDPIGNLYFITSTRFRVSSLFHHNLQLAQAAYVLLPPKTCVQRNVRANGILSTPGELRGLLQTYFCLALLVNHGIACDHSSCLHSLENDVSCSYFSVVLDTSDTYERV